MKNINIAVLLLFVGLWLGYSCNDPTLIGSDLLSEDQLDISFTDTITLRSYSQDNDSIRTYSPSILTGLFTSFLVGSMDEPVFGQASSTVNAQIVMGFSGGPDFSNLSLTCDSIVLILPYFENAIYGDIDQLYGLEIRALEEDLDFFENYYSNQTFQTSNGLIGSAEFYPSLDSVTVVKHGNPDTFDLIEPHLRVRIDENNLAQEKFFSRSNQNYESDTTFLDFMKGIQIIPTTTNDGMVSFDLNSSLAGVTVYYHLDTNFFEYTFPLYDDRVRFPIFTSNESGSVIEEFLPEGSIPEKDSLIFIQGMNGPDGIIEFPFADKLTNIVVNKAELELKILRLDDFEPIDQLVISEIRDDSTKVLIQDVAIAQTRASVNFGQIFGGFPEEDDTYRLNISNHFQSMIEGEVSKRIQISVFAKGEKAARVVVGGSGHADFPAKLNLSFTRY